jgi:class 3 adenylate cyclase
MTNLRTTVVTKTDLSDYTVRVQTLVELDLSALLNEHRNFIMETAAKHEGTAIKGEGDSFWLIFPSATSATLAAIEMQKELRTNQIGKPQTERLVIRIVIALGDVLHQGHDIFGDAVNLAARIEKVTPPDEIYLSQAAWLALNKAEVQTMVVGEVNLKGIAEPVTLYRVSHEHKTRIIKDECILMSDLAGFSSLISAHPMPLIEKALVQLDEIHRRVCEDFSGTIRINMGDGYGLTFSEPHLMLSAASRLCAMWERFRQELNLNCWLVAGAHQGDLYIFRWVLHGNDINDTFRLQGITRQIAPKQNCVLVSERVRAEVRGTPWEQRLLKREWADEKSGNVLTVYELVPAPSPSDF